MNFFIKLILLVIYPFVYLFHPKMRKLHTSRIKYWAVDRDFFKDEIKSITTIGVLAFAFYFFVFYGFAMTVGGAAKLNHAIGESYEDITREARESFATKPEDRSKFDTNVVQEVPDVEIKQEEYDKITTEVKHKDELNETQNDAENLLEKARKQKCIREGGTNC